MTSRIKPGRRPRKKGSAPTPGTREVVARAIDEAFPDGVIEMPCSADESWFAAKYPAVQQALAGLAGTALLYERDADGEVDRRVERDVFFVGLTGEPFSNEVNEESSDEEGREQSVRGQVTTGCTIGVSLVAPLAIVVIDEIEHLEDGSSRLPDVHPSRLDLDGKPLDLLDPELPVREVLGEDGVQTLLALRERIVTLLESTGIAVLTYAETALPLSALKAGEDVHLPTMLGQPITVRDAFFFRAP